MAEDFMVTITNPERAAEWQAVFGTTTVHVQSPIPFEASLPGRPRSLVYLLDLRLISDDQRRKLVEHLARKFGLAKSFVDAELDAHGVPLLAEDCVATVDHPQKWF